MAQQSSFRFSSSLLINEIRRSVVSKAFQSNRGKRSLVLIAEFPFLIIGTIQDVVRDYVIIETETTSIAELEGKNLNIHIDQVQVFYIETGGKKIPRIETNTP